MIIPILEWSFHPRSRKQEKEKPCVTRQRLILFKIGSPTLVTEKEAGPKQSSWFKKLAWGGVY